MSRGHFTTLVLFGLLICISVDLYCPLASKADPCIVGQFDTPDQAVAVEIRGDVAYLVDKDYGLFIVDISNPSDPVQIGNVDLPNVCTSVALSGDFAYVCVNSTGLFSVDISDPTNPVISDSPSPNYSAVWVVIEGNFAYVASYTAGLRIVDISDPTNLLLVNTVPTPYQTRGVAVNGQYAYMADTENGLQVVDVSSPSMAAIVGSVDTPGIANLPIAHGSLVYLFDSEEGIQVIDVSVPSSPQIITTVDIPGSAWRGDIAGDKIYFADRTHGIGILDISVPAAPILLENLETPDDTLDGAFFAGYPIAVDRHAGLLVLCGSATNGPLAYYPFDGNANDESGNGYDGTVVGAQLTQDRDGNLDSAYEFDGTGETYIDVGTNLKVPLPITVAAWVKPDSSRAGIVFRNDNVDGRAYYHGVSVFVHHGRLAGWVGSGYAGPSSRKNKTTLEAPIPVNEWSHVAVVFNDYDDMQLYVNGVEYEGELGGTGTGMTYSANGHGFIGSGTFLNPGYTDFDGDIDEVRFYERALAAGEIQELYGGVQIAGITVDHFVVVGEHPELNSLMISPGEKFYVQLILTNNTNQTVTVNSFRPVGLTAGVDLADLTTPVILQIPAGETALLVVDVLLEITNWPVGVANLVVRFDIQYRIGGEDFLLESDDEFTIPIDMPDAAHTLTVPELQDLVRSGNYDPGEIVAVRYIPFIRFNRNGASDGLAAGALITQGLTGVFKGFFEVGQGLKTASKVAGEFIAGQSDEEEYNSIWFVAGMQDEVETNPTNNIFLTSNPDLSPRMWEPSWVIARLENLFDHQDSLFDLQTEVTAPLLAPLVWVEARELPANEIYLVYEEQSPGSLLGESVVVDGVVHQNWQDDSTGDYYFSIVTVNEEDFSNIFLIGPLLNIGNRTVTRLLCRVGSGATVPRMGSTIRARGVYAEIPDAGQVPLPSNWSGIYEPVRYYYYTDVTNITYSSGGPSDLSDLEQEFFDTNLSDWPSISIDLPAPEGDARSRQVESTIDLHLYDAEGNHTGPVYDVTGQVVDYDLEIEGSIHSSYRRNPQFVFINSLNEADGQPRDLYYELVPRGTGSAALNLFTFSTDPADSVTYPHELITEFEYTPLDTLGDYLDWITDEEGAVVLDSLTVEVMGSLTIWETAWLQELDETLTIYLGNMTGGPVVAEIDVATVLLGGQVVPVPGSDEILDSAPGFEGPVLVLEFSRIEAVAALNSTDSSIYLVPVDFLLVDETPMGGGFLVQLIGDEVAAVGDNAPVVVRPQNFPNPFNPATTIRYALRRDGFVRLSIHDLRGRLVKQLVSEQQAVGEHEIVWIGKDEKGHAVSSGVYLCKLVTPSGSYTHKLALVR